MAKKAIYFEEAQRQYVKQGFGLTAIEGMLDGNVTRRTLHTWKDEGNWDEKRKRYLEQHEDLSDMVMEIAKNTAKKALQDPNPKNMLALIRAINALKEKDALAMFANAKEGEGEESEEEDVTQVVRDALKEIMGA